MAGSARLEIAYNIETSLNAREFATGKNQIISDNNKGACGLATPAPFSILRTHTMKVTQFRNRNQEIATCSAGEYGQAEMRFNPKTGVCDFYLEGRWIYGLNLQFHNVTESLDWVRQISQKTWCSTQTISNMCTFALGVIKREAAIQ